MMAEPVIALSGNRCLVNPERRVPNASAIKVTMRAESDSRPSCAIDSMTSNFSKKSFLSGMSAGHGSVGTGFGVFSHARVLCRRCSTSRTDVTY